MLMEWEIVEKYGKSIWKMTMEELSNYDLWGNWLELVKLNEMVI